MEFVTVAAGYSQSCRNRMHDGAHVGISERRGIRLVIDYHVGTRHRVTVIRGATGILVDDVNEVALAKVAQEILPDRPSSWQWCRRRSGSCRSQRAASKPQRARHGTQGQPENAVLLSLAQCSG